MTLTRTSSTNSSRSTQSSKTSHDSLMIGVTRDKEDTKPAAKNTNIPQLVSMESIVPVPVSTQMSQTLYNYGKSFAEQNPNATEADANKEFDKWYATKQAYDIGKQFTEQNPNVTEAQKQDHEELTIQFLKQKYLADHKKSYSI